MDERILGLKPKSKEELKLILKRLYLEQVERSSTKEVDEIVAKYILKKHIGQTLSEAETDILTLIDYITELEWTIAKNE